MSKHDCPYCVCKYDIFCVICGRKFTPKKRAISCENEQCRKELARRRVERWRRDGGQREWLENKKEEEKAFNLKHN